MTSLKDLAFKVRCHYLLSIYIWNIDFNISHFHIVHQSQGIQNQINSEIICCKLMFRFSSWIKSILIFEFETYLNWNCSIYLNYGKHLEKQQAGLKRHIFKSVSFPFSSIYYWISFPLFKRWSFLSLIELYIASKSYFYF